MLENDITEEQRKEDTTDSKAAKTKYNKKIRKSYNKKKQKRKWQYHIMSISSIVYIVWRLFFTLPLGLGFLDVFFGLLLFVSELIAVAESLLSQNAYHDTVLPELPDIPDDMYPDVDILIATHTEEAELLYKTINSCKYLKYPDKSKVHIYICDDMNRSGIAKLASELEVGYITILNNKHAKAGNLNNAFSKTNSPLVVTLDADMIPKSDFLMKTVPYFFLPKVKKLADGTFVMKKEDEINPSEKIGFVQTPQTFYNPDMFQYNLFAEETIPNEQDYFFREVNVGRNATNSPIYAGSNTVISREALDEIGGIRVGTITEDFATGMDIQGKGYTCIAIPDPLVSGLSPTSIDSLIKQRVRWGRGCVQTLLKASFLFGKNSLESKMSYFGALLYWTTFFRRTIYIFAPILYAVFGIVVVDLDMSQYLIIGIPTYIIYNIALRQLSEGLKDFRWSNIVDTILAPYLVLPILMETFGIRLKKFNVTQKTRETSKNSNISYAIPNILFLVASVIGIVFVCESIIFGAQYFNLIILFWLSINSYFLIMSVIFMLGRVNYRSSERFEVSLPIEIYYKGDVLQGKVNDISETGLSFTLVRPVFFNYDDLLDIRVTDRGYEARMTAKIVHSLVIDETTCKYNLMITEIDEKNKSQFFALIYDRQFVFSKGIKTRGIDDLINFIKTKFRKSEESNRVLPRIHLNTNYVNINNKKLFYVFDFNGHYFTTSSEEKKLSFYMDKDIIAHANYVRDIDLEKKLFEVDNWNELARQLRNSDFLNEVKKAKGSKKK